MRRLKFPSGISTRNIMSPFSRFITAGMAILVCLSLGAFALSACAELPEPLAEIPAPQTATPFPQPQPTAAPTVAPTATGDESATVLKVESPTPIPTMTPKASTIILRVLVASANESAPYDRGDWRHWTDEDGDCQNTRHEVLVAESISEVKFRDSEGCHVEAGRWSDSYTGDVFTDSSDLDVDHMVPLANAHKSGGYAWDSDRKREYANDLTYDGHLIAVSASANRSKGAKGPDGWRPPNRDYWCQYAMDWVFIKWEWRLTATDEEAAALSEMLASCETRIFLQSEKVNRAEEDRATRTVAPTPVDYNPAPTPIPTKSVPPPTPASTPIPDRNCSDFDSWSEAQKFYEEQGGPDVDPHRLDRDRDGTACQSLPGAPKARFQPAPTPRLVNFPRPLPDRNCAELAKQFEDQALYEGRYGNPDIDTGVSESEALCFSLMEASSDAIEAESSGAETALLSVSCSDFVTWDEAQAFFILHGGPESDPYDLDFDENGIPCQSVSGAPAIYDLIEAPLEDLDCGDFAAWSEAQAFYEEHGGPDVDPHNLDRDADGIACQSLPGAPSDTLLASQDRNCSDFDTWSAAQSFFESEGGPGSDPHRLDRDGDGVACQSLPGAPGSGANTRSSSIESTSKSKTKDTRNCSDFATWSAAQSFFESEGGPSSDPHRLDRDGDGIACQSLPGAPGESSPTPKPEISPAPADNFDDRNCSDFDTWSAAQSFFESEGGPSSDPHSLDRDGDGVACQSLPGAPGESMSTPKPESVPTPTPTSVSEFDDRNCSDFDTWSAAQSFFESEGGPSSDRHRLDRDGDGVACQSLPGAPGESTSSSKPESAPTPADNFDDRNCSDFATWSAAQSFFESEGGPSSDRHRLDRDGDGVACQSLPGAPGESTSSSKPESVPTPTPTSVDEFDDRNCSDFDTWSAAQSFFESEGGPSSDRHRLDRDGDGVACQSLPGAPGESTPTPTPKPESVPTPTPTSVAEFDDRNCSDFDTWSAAQSFFESEGGPSSDRHRLDRDGDGIACQSLPGAPGESTPTPTPKPESSPTPTPAPSADFDDRNCSDFATWSAAQSFFESEGGPGSDPHRLDRDGDGVACQSLPGAPGESTPTPTPKPESVPTPTPVPSADFDDRNCSDFDTWSAAQSFFESEGGPGSDRHRLDRDGDGVACQSLPGAPGESTPTPKPESSPSPTPAPSADFDDRNCSDFDTWSAAQSFFESEGGPSSDPHRLDRDGDGVACQSLPGAPKRIQRQSLHPNLRAFSRRHQLPVERGPDAERCVAPQGQLLWSPFVSES